MQIQDVVDVDTLPYVCPFNMHVDTPWGKIHVPRGFLSDGASGVLDLSKEAFFTHDRLYVCPEIDGERIGKAKSDIIYGYLLFKDKRFIRTILRPLGLFVLGWPAWSGYRKREVEDKGWWLQERIVPPNTCWNFPDWHTKNAVFID